uniref:Uncharacterized protein n=1 Tax=Anolis carolinensis TaxID=28377 RepID=A0A803SPD8_ANOCA
MGLTLLLSAYKLCRLAMSGPGVRPEGWWAEGLGPCPEASPGLAADIQAALDRALPDLHQAVSAAKRAAGPQDLQAALAEILALVEEAWLMPALGREVARGLCHAVRMEGGLDLLLALLQDPDLQTRCQAGRLLEQILVAENRDRVARVGLGAILNLAKERENAALAPFTAGILAHMFKHSEETSLRLIADGALDAVLFWCRWSDPGRAAPLRGCPGQLRHLRRAAEPAADGREAGPRVALPAGLRQGRRLGPVPGLPGRGRPGRQQGDRARGGALRHPGPGRALRGHARPRPLRPHPPAQRRPQPGTGRRGPAGPGPAPGELPPRGPVHRRLLPLRGGRHQGPAEEHQGRARRRPPKTPLRPPTGPQRPPKPSKALPNPQKTLKKP